MYACHGNPKTYEYRAPCAAGRSQGTMHPRPRLQRWSTLHWQVWQALSTPGLDSMRATPPGSGGCRRAVGAWPCRAYRGTTLAAALSVRRRRGLLFGAGWRPVVGGTAPNAWGRGHGTHRRCRSAPAHHVRTRHPERAALVVLPARRQRALPTRPHACDDTLCLLSRRDVGPSDGSS